MSKIPQWAAVRACELAMQEGTLHWSPDELQDAVSQTHAPLLRALARYIAEHESPPVDPRIAEEAAKISADWGCHSSHEMLVAAIKRGMDLVHEEQRKAGKARQ